MNLKIYICLGLLICYTGYQSYKLNTVEKDYKTFKTETNLQNDLYKKEIDDLTKNITTQNKEISALKLYNKESEQNSNEISNLKQKYNNIKHDAKDITDFQNDIFSKFSGEDNK